MEPWEANCSLLDQTYSQKWFYLKYKQECELKMSWKHISAELNLNTQYTLISRMLLSDYEFFNKIRPTCQHKKLSYKSDILPYMNWSTHEVWWLGGKKSSEIIFSMRFQADLMKAYNALMTHIHQHWTNIYV